jgi:hypothetical protein
MMQPPQKPKPAARNHPDDRSRIEAGNSITRLYHGESETKSPLSYYTPLLIHCTLPHSDPKTRDWKKTNGDFTLIVSSGVDKDLNPYGIPYGSFPRLMLAHIITRVIQTGERRIELSSHFGSFLKEVGYTGNFKGNSRAGKTIRDQMIRLIKASISAQAQEGNAEHGAEAGSQMLLTDDYVFWWDYRQPDQESLFGSWIELSDKFYKAILSAPVPLRTDILAALRKSPLALDVYMWTSYRLFTMQQRNYEQISLSYGQLQNQFGTGISETNYRSFRRDLKTAFTKVAKYWHAPGTDYSQLNYEFGEKEVTLYRSPLMIGKAKLKGTAAEAERILSNKTFDAETRKKARVLAGKWSLDFLQGQYFEWIAAEGIAPTDPRAHFFTFIKAHRKRNGETV